MATEQAHAVGLDRVDHPLRLRQAQRHRLLDDDVLAVLRGEDRVLAVELVRRRNPDHLDVRVAAELLDAVIAATAVALLKGRERFRPQVRRRYQLDLRRVLQGPDDLDGAGAEAGDADLEPALRCPGPVLSSLERHMRTFFRSLFRIERKVSAGAARLTTASGRARRGLTNPLCSDR